LEAIAKFENAHIDRASSAQLPSQAKHEDLGNVAASRRVRDVIVKVEQGANHVEEENNRKLEQASQEAVAMATERGLQISRDMRNRALAKAQIAKKEHEVQGKELETLQQQMYNDLVCHAALHEALARNGMSQNVFHSHGVTDSLFMAISNSKDAEYEIMVEKLDQILCATRQSSAYVVSILSYTKEGLDLVLCMSTLSGDCFQMRVGSDSTVAQLMETIRLQKQDQSSHLERVARSLSRNQINVKVIGPAGTSLDASRTFPAAIDYETDGTADDAEELDHKLYPLSVLAGDAWRETGIDGATRWKHLAEKDFMGLFGMNKASFEKLPSWKQIPLKKKHGLF